MGIDPGTQHIGYAVSTPDGWKAGELSVSDGPMHQRLYLLGHALASVFEKIKPDIVIIEEAFVGKDARVAIAMGRAQAVAMIVAASYGCVVETVVSAAAKKCLTGKGNAKKEDVQRFAERMGRFDRKLKEHEADAFAVAHWFVESYDWKSGICTSPK